MITINDLFIAYRHCRKNKRNTIDAINFEINLESNLIDLFNDIINKTYKISRSIAFVVKKPVCREIFAGSFKDRIVHHLIYNKINYLLEKCFIYDSYSCRVDKGTSFGIKRVYKFIRSCSQNYTKNCYIMKLDIHAFFMSIDKDILFNKLKNILIKKYTNNDLEIILYLCEKVIYNDPTKNCIIKGEIRNWENVPKNKSLFYTPKNKGLPIGNLTSQIFANFYLNEFDHYIKHDLKIKYYGRYVDDMIFVHEDKDFLKEIKLKANDFLEKNLKLKLHPNKVYIQHYSKGVIFLGAKILPYHIIPGKRLIKNFKKTIHRYNNIYQLQFNELTDEQTKKLTSSINSYLGILSQYKSYNFRKKIIKKILFKNHIKISKNNTT